MKMKKRKKGYGGELPHVKERERIGNSAEERFYAYEFDAEQNVRFRRWSSVYLGTAVAAIVMLCVLLLSVSMGDHAPSSESLWGRSAEALGNMFLQLDFMDLSGNRTVGDDQGSNKNPVLNDFLIPDRQEGGMTNPENPSKDETEKTPLSKDTLYAFDYDAVPEGQTPIVPMNLALSSYGSSYIHNSTGYTPNTAALLAGELKQSVDFEYLSASGSPMVLIVHTHATESYSADGAHYYDEGADDEYARSKDMSKNMIAVGKALADELKAQGIASVHCTVLHDEVQYKDSYRRSEESIRQYLEKYPTIRLVIDLHRDAVVKSSGDLVRPVTLYEGEAVAQLMCVVGSDWGGSTYDNWEQNLSLALKLRESLNAACPDLCRPTYLKSSTYNQELGPYSLLIEAGASGNSLEEVLRSMKLLAASLRTLLPEM